MLFAVIVHVSGEAGGASLMFPHLGGAWGGTAGFTVQLGCWLGPNSQ